MSILIHTSVEDATGRSLTVSQRMNNGIVHANVGSNYSDVLKLVTTSNVSSTGMQKARRRLAFPYTPAGALPGSLKLANVVIEFSIPGDMPVSAAEGLVRAATDVAADSTTMALIKNRVISE